MGTESGVATMEDSVRILKQLQIELPLAIYSGGLKSGSRRDRCPVCYKLFTIAMETT